MLKAQNVQYSYFASNAQALKASAIFEHTFGIEPDFTQSNKTPNPETPFFSAAVGVIDAGVAQLNLQVHVNPGRIDVNFTPVEDQTSEEVPLLDPLMVYNTYSGALIGDYVNELNLLRISTFTNLVRVFPSQDESTRFLMEQSGIQGFEGCTDFSFQINRRKPFGSDKNYSMNRVIRLAESTFQKFVFNINQNQQSAVNQVRFGGIVLIDLNTVPDGNAIPPHIANRLMEDLISEMVTLIRSDIPLLEIKQ